MAIYRCDPLKHKYCKRTECGRNCFHTVFEEFSTDKVPREFVQTEYGFDDPPVLEKENEQKDQKIC